MNARVQPVRTTRRLPTFLSEHYEVSINADKLPTTAPKIRTITMRSTRATRATTKVPRPTLKSTSAPKKKSPAKKQSVTTRPALAVARSSPSPVAVASAVQTTPSVVMSGVKGCVEPNNWAIASRGITEIPFPRNARPMSLTQLLNGCIYHKGVINPINTHHASHSIELCFVFDLTHSMYKCVTELKQKLQELTAQLLKDIPAIKIAMIAHGDYHSARDSYCMQKLDFSNDPTTITNFISSLVSANGWDTQECYEMALLEAQKLNWSHHSMNDMLVTRCVVMIGDDIPHGPTEYCNIDWKQELVKLRDEIGCKVYSVQCLAREKANEFYQTLADETLGQRFVLDNFKSISDVFMGLCYREATEHAEKNFADEDQVGTTGFSIVRGGSLSDDDLLRVHAAVHNYSCDSIEVGGVTYPISVGNAGCRFARIDDIVYIEQNKEKKTKYAKMALEGKSITWVCTPGANWGLVIDNEVVRR